MSRLIDTIEGFREEYLATLKEEDYRCCDCQRPVGDTEETAYVTLYRNGNFKMYCGPCSVQVRADECDTWYKANKTYTCVTCKKPGRKVENGVHVDLDILGSPSPRCLGCHKADEEIGV